MRGYKGAHSMNIFLQQNINRAFIVNIIVIHAVLFTVLIGQPFQKAKPEYVGMSSKRLERLTTTLDQYVEDEKLAGGVALVLRKGKSVYSHAFGYRDIEANDVMEKDDIFRIASQTKAIISVGVMILQEQGKLLIQEPVGKYLPEYNETTVAKKDGDTYRVVPAKRKIAIKDLLTHTSGIGWGYGPGQEAWETAEIMGWYFADKNEPIRETVKKIATLPMDAHPGEQYVYGLSTDVLGALIEVVSGMRLDQFLAKEIFKPLKMNDTHFYLQEDKLPRLTVVYSSNDNGIEISPDPGSRVGAAMIGQGHYVSGPRVSYSGGAGLLSTAEDYAIFLQMMLNKGQFKNQRILSRKSVELMTVNHIKDIPFWFDGVRFGLGFGLVEDLGGRGELGSIGEFSWGGAYHSFYWVDPQEELVVVYLTQLIPALNIDDSAKLRSLIYQAIID